MYSRGKVLRKLSGRCLDSKHSISLVLAILSLTTDGSQFQESFFSADSSGHTLNESIFIEAPSKSIS